MNYYSSDTTTHNYKRSGFLPLLIAGIVGVVLGVGIGNAWATKNFEANTAQYGVGGGPNVQALTPNAHTKAADLRVKLHSLLKEHAVLTATGLKQIYDGKNNEFEITKNAQAQNSQDLSNVIQSVYGAQVKSEFDGLWNDHINQYEAYARALRANNAKGMSDAKQTLDEHSQMLDSLLKAGSNINTDIKGLLDEHVKITLTIVDAYAKRNYADVEKYQKDAYEQAGKIADTLTNVFIKIRPADYI